VAYKYEKTATLCKQYSMMYNDISGGWQHGEMTHQNNLAHENRSQQHDISLWRRAPSSEAW